MNVLEDVLDSDDAVSALSEVARGAARGSTGCVVAAQLLFNASCGSVGAGWNERKPRLPLVAGALAG